MASAKRVFRKFRASDGRIKVATLSGVSALVAVIALLVGVLPVFATNGDAVDNTDEGVHPEAVQYGGGSGACDFVDVDSDARFELHINNPASDSFFAPDGTRVDLTLDEDDPRIFSYEFVGVGGDPAVMAAYDVVVNGGAHNLWYDNDGQGGALQSDGNLHAPRKNNGDIHNLSHINICYDVQPSTLVCDGAPVDAVFFGDGSITAASAQVFNNSVEYVDCSIEKQALFFADNNADPDELTLAFQGDGGVVAGRLDVTKDFTEDSTPNDPTDFKDLTYNGPGEFVDLQWCEIRGKIAGDGNEFQVDEVLASGEYPSLEGIEDTLSDGVTTVDATACKVFEGENAAGIQHTVVYFEFVDPQFR